MLKLILFASRVSLAACTHHLDGLCARYHGGNNPVAYDHSKSDT